MPFGPRPEHGSIRSLDRFTVRLLVLSIVLLMLVGSLAEAYISERRSSQTAASIAALCPFWRDLAQLPLSATSTKLAFTIIADTRIAYAKQSCEKTTGALPEPDPRVKPLLPAGVK